MLIVYLQNANGVLAPLKLWRLAASRQLDLSWSQTTCALRDAELFRGAPLR